MSEVTGVPVAQLKTRWTALSGGWGGVMWELTCFKHMFQLLNECSVLWVIVTQWRAEPSGSSRPTFQSGRCGKVSLRLHINHIVVAQRHRYGICWFLIWCWWFPTAPWFLTHILVSAAFWSTGEIYECDFSRTIMSRIRAFLRPKRCCWGFASDHKRASSAVTCVTASLQHV